CGLVRAWRLAISPTRISPSLKATTEGVVRPPSALTMTFGSPPSITATHEFVVPKSIPIILLMIYIFLLFAFVYFNQGRTQNPVLKGIAVLIDLKNDIVFFVFVVFDFHGVMIRRVKYLVAGVNFL